MDANEQLLQPKGEETMQQDDTGPSHLEAEAGDAAGALVHDGKYKRYSFYGVIFEVPVKYKPLVPIGRGAYGIVCSAQNLETGEEVAIKKIGNAFADRMDAKRTLREILLLRSMDHPNVMTLRDLIRPANPRQFKDAYLVYELMPTDLHEVIKSGQAMDERHYRFILYQILRGLKYIHSANVLHRDLKPPNILIDAKCNVRITDFGLARTHNIPPAAGGMDASPLDAHMTEYVVTRYYRAPELLVNCRNYGTAIDIWSVGCIYLELLMGRILLKGENYIDQLRRTCELLGTPTAEDLSFVENDSARNYILHDMPKYPPQPLRSLFPSLTEAGADLVSRMLMFDPHKRITVDEALEHPYLSHYHSMNEEPCHPTPFAYDLSFEGPEFDTARIRQLIYEQSCIFNPQG